jgi:hypothetical protein
MLMASDHEFRFLHEGTISAESSTLYLPITVQVSTYAIAAIKNICSIKSKLPVRSLSHMIIFFSPQVHHFHLACSLHFHAQIDVRRQWPLCAKISGLSALGTVE